MSDKDAVVNKKFDEFVAQIEIELPNMKTEQIIMGIIPTLSEANNHGATPYIKLTAAKTAIKVLRHIEGRDDGDEIQVVELDKASKKPTGRQGFGNLIETLEKQVNEQLALMEKAHVEKPLGSIWENVTVDAILNTPMAKDLDRPND
jgi:hypothetical protein